MAAGIGPLLQDTDDVLGAAEAAVVETAAVARAGYRETPTRENALFNLLSSFAATFLAAGGPPTCCGPDAGSVPSATSWWAGAISTTSCRGSRSVSPRVRWRS